MLHTRRFSLLNPLEHQKAHAPYGSFPKASFLSEIRVELFTTRSIVASDPFHSDLVDELAIRLSDELSSLCISPLPPSIAFAQAVFVFHRASLLDFDRETKEFQPAERVVEERQGTLVVVLSARCFLDAVDGDGARMRSLVDNIRAEVGMKGFEKQLRVLVFLTGDNGDEVDGAALQLRIAEATLSSRLFLYEG